MSNHTILERNIMHAFQASPMSEEMNGIFLRFSMKDPYKAEQLAWACERVAPFVDICEGYPKRAVDEVRQFIKERICMMYFPKNGRR